MQLNCDFSAHILPLYSLKRIVYKLQNLQAIIINNIQKGNKQYNFIDKKTFY